MLSIVVGNFLKAVHDIFALHLDRQFSPAIEAAGGKIDGAYDGVGMIGQQHFGVQFQVLQLVNFDTHIFHDEVATA